MTPIKVVIADDHALFRDGLKKNLSLEKDILVVGEAANGDEISKVVDRAKPDILLLDVKMPKGDVVQSLLDVAARSPATRVIVQGRKGSRAGIRMLQGLVLHESDGSYTEAAEAVLRGGAALPLGAQMK